MWFTLMGLVSTSTYSTRHSWASTMLRRGMEAARHENCVRSTTGRKARGLHEDFRLTVGGKPMNLRTIWELFRATVTEWWEDNAPRLGAALAFYTLLSLAPLLVVVTAIAGLIFGQAAAEGQLVAEIQDLVGPRGAEAIQTLLANAHEPTTGLIATAVSLVVLLL